ncbi:MAG: ribosomal protein S18-alanine N-acetyltransferase [Clostridiales bacterium]|nr:ribosomal protein S18-alanine N-acetyltransferase [Clostridiales bacterium]
MMNEINIREMTVDDIDSIHEIEVKSFTVPWSKNAFYQEIAENNAAFYFVISFNKKLIGYMGIWKIFDEGHITNIALDNEYRGQGLSKKLLAHVIEKMTDKGVIHYTLEVRESNQVAQNLYKGFGFSVKGKRKKYYADTNEDALLMWLSLN